MSALEEGEGIALLPAASRKPGYGKYESICAGGAGTDAKGPVDKDELQLSLQNHYQRRKVLGPEVFLEPATLKSVPLSAPYSRLIKNRSYGLIWISEFRHWWKWSRLLVRLAGLYAYLQDDKIWTQVLSRNLLKKKGPATTLKLIRRLSQGGFVRPFFQNVQPFTRAVRILVGVWRTVEASRCRRREVRMAEIMAFFGNRCARDLSKEAVDFVCEWVLIPLLMLLIEWKVADLEDIWHPAYFIIFFGLLRAVAPFMASFQGSRFGRSLSKAYYNSANDRWLPSMRIGDVNLSSDDCCEFEEMPAAKYNADLVVLAKQFATLLSKDMSDPGNVPFRNQHLEDAGFHQIGRGAGGYSVYRFRNNNSSSGEEQQLQQRSVLIHVTPYGPSMYDELARYVVIERDGVKDTRRTWRYFMRQFLFDQPEIVEGYCFKGAFFSKYHFASMKEKYEEVMAGYQQACKTLCCSNSAAAHNSKQEVPPTDLVSLKAFIEHGKPSKKQKKHVKAYNELQSLVDRLSQHVRSQMAAHLESHCVAPRGVILYFEGLDCAGKSSTGTLVQAALERAGFAVFQRRYNRPPTAAQKQLPWMDRFERPEQILAESTEAATRVAEESAARHGDKHNHVAVVWDRGPAGDFVYGNLSSASEDRKEQFYREFMDFEAVCRHEHALFFKMMFLSNRDAIASTLGKRLAHKKICLDLQAWLDASSERSEAGKILREGLMEIEDHLDPTDFVAFNSYHDNLQKFAKFAKKTDTMEGRWSNPWLVINTSKRHPGRLAVLHRFKQQLNDFVKGLHLNATQLTSAGSSFYIKKKHDLGTFKKYLRLHLRMVVLFMVALTLVYIYLINHRFVNDSA